MSTPLAPGFRFSGQTKHRLSYEQVKRLAQAFGLPGDAMAQIAKGESGLNADVQQRDPGDGMVGYGLLQMTPNAWGKGSAAYKHMQSLGGIEAMNDPVKNMAMARFLYKSAGNKLTPWYGTKFLTNRSGEGALGPVDRSRIGGGLSAGPATGTTTQIPGQTITSTIPTVDKTGFEQARKLAIVGGLIAKRNPNSFLLRSGLLSTQEPTLSSFVGSKTVKDVIPGATVRTAKASFSTPSSQSGTANFEGKKVAAWIAPALEYARSQGWKGSVNSGFRSFADQQRIYNSGVRPAAKPGTSNHEGTQFPRGAVDVSDAPQLAAILKRSKYRGRLQWAGAKDPVHFSHPHGGSY